MPKMAAVRARSAILSLEALQSWFVAEYRCATERCA